MTIALNNKITDLTVERRAVWDVLVSAVSNYYNENDLLENIYLFWIKSDEFDYQLYMEDCLLNILLDEKVSQLPSFTRALATVQSTYGEVVVDNYLLVKSVINCIMERRNINLYRAIHHAVISNGNDYYKEMISLRVLLITFFRNFYYDVFVKPTDLA